MKIICVGLNYAEHIDEIRMRKNAEPVIFLKPDSAILRVNTPFFIPDFAREFHYETEIVARICRVGRSIETRFAHRYYDQIGIGIDFTARDLQRRLASDGHPWELAKAFDQSAAISDFLPKTDFADVQNIDFRLEVNGQIRQRGNTKNMIHTIDEIVAFVSQYFTLKMGDLIYTGTPSGVGEVTIGDRLQAYIGEKKMMDFLIK